MELTDEKINDLPNEIVQVAKDYKTISKDKSVNNVNNEENETQPEEENGTIVNNVNITKNNNFNNIISDKEILLEELVTKFGEERKQKEEQINKVINLLNENWLTTLSQYYELSPQQRAKVGLPLLLEQELDNYKQGIPNALTQLIIPESANEEERIQRFNSKIKLEEIPKGTYKDFCYIYRDIKQKKFILTVGDTVWKFSDEITLKELLLSLPSPAELRCSNSIVNENTKITIAITPPRILVIAGTPHHIMDNFHFKGVENWLSSLGLRKHTHTFLKHYIDDFLVIPFLRGNDLEYMGITDPDEKRKIMSSVKELQDGDNFEYMSKWLQNLGFGKYSKAFINNYFEICFLNRLKESHLERIGVDLEDRAQIFEIIKQYSEFSSVEATYTWLRDHGFEKDSFQFVRFNIPFYALPMVNFFIINEMGISNYRELLVILRELKDTPAYKVKAMAYWLRDLELERYSLVFAKNLLVDFIESLTILTDAHISRLIEWEDDKEKMKRAVHDMKEFQMYYSATSSLLQEFLIEKYSQLFATHGISIDELPNLTDKKLLEMGITDAADRARILLGVDKMKEELPVSPSTSVSVASYYSLQRPYQSSNR